MCMKELASFCPFQKRKSPISSRPSSHPPKAEPFNSACRRMWNFPLRYTKFSELHLVASTVRKKETSDCTETRTTHTNHISPLVLQLVSKSLTHLSPYAGQRNYANHKVQSNHLISTEQDLCSDPNASCVRILLGNIYKSS